MEERTHLSKLIDHFKDYLVTRLDLLVLTSAKKSFKILSIIFSNLLFVGILMFFFIFLSIGVSLWFSEYFMNSYIGFLLVAAFYLLVGFIVYFKINWLEEKINNVFITQFFMEEEEDE